MKIFALISLTLSFFVVGCGAQSGTSINGTITMDSGWKPILYLVRPQHFSEIASDYRGLVVDSAVIDQHGSFAFKSFFDTKVPTLYFLTMQPVNSHFANHLMDEQPAAANYMPIVVEPGQSISLTAKANTFHLSFRLTSPSADNQSLIDLRDVRIAAYEEYSSKLDSDHENDTLILEREQHFLRYAQHLMDFADSTTSYMTGMVAIRWISPAGDYERMPEFIHRQCQKWQQRQPDDVFAKELCQLTTDGQLPVMIGDIMPDFALPMVTGDTVSLKALLGKKLTIVDIWASWCAPCRKENRAYLSPLYATYKAKGLQIIGYSIDNDGDAWQKAILKDQALWLHASHLTGDSTPFLDALRITTIPANFILDEYGKVLAKNVYGEELRQLIEELMH